jgi:hypothetical protein
LYKYKFPQGSVTFKDHEVALAGMSIYYSWYNISAEKRNNQFSYIWNADTAVTYNVTIPDGNYTFEELYTYFQFAFIQNKTYMIDGSGNYVYFIELLFNSTKNLMEVICYPLPTVLGTYSIPVGATWTLGSGETPQLIIPSYTKSYTSYGQLLLSGSSFGSTIGFVSGTYPSSPQLSIYNVLGTMTDALYPVNSMNINCSLLYNTLSVPTTSLYTFPVSNYKYGELITVAPVELIYVPVKDGSYWEFEIKLIDQDGNDIYLRDTDLVINLAFKQKEEVTYK